MQFRHKITTCPYPTRGQFVFAVKNPNINTSDMSNTTFKHHDGDRSEVLFDKAQDTYFNPYSRMYVPTNLTDLPDLTEIDFVNLPKSE